MYDGKRKQTWRGWWWNQITSRLAVKPCEAVAAYLAGPDDHDREWALKRGFQDSNLIAVDRDDRVINACRERGVIGVDLSIAKVLMHWPSEMPLHIVSADLCCGFNSYSMEVLSIGFLSKGIGNNSVFAVNMMRGRDDGLKIVEDLDAAMASRILHNARGLTGNALHRGGQLFAWFIAMCERLLLHHAASSGRPCASASYTHRWREVAMPAFSSYKSDTCNAYFDSVVFTWPFGDGGGMSNQGFLRNELTPKGEYNRRKLIAMKAVRTAKRRVN